jgi:hypothetical protein
MTQDSHARLTIVAKGLKSLLPDVTFVGGAVTALYATNPAAPTPRPSLDVDCVVVITSRMQYARLEHTLEQLGFKHDTRQGAPICRWLLQEIQVDIMPTDPRILGFANRWSAEGVGSSMVYTLSPGLSIRLLDAPFFLASKLEALQSRGGDLRLSGDFDDIVFLIDNRPEIVHEMAHAPRLLIRFVRECLQDLLRKGELQEAIESVLAFGPERKRAAGIMKVFESLTRHP